MGTEKLVTWEIVSLLDRYDKFSFLPGYRSRIVFEFARLMLDEDKVALLRAAITEPAELIDIVEMTTGGT